jgi:ABC-type transport system involved in cytochrome c biogenesis permease subunit
LGELFHKLPNLQILDEANYRFVTTCFPLFTLAILAGVLWAESARGSYLRDSPKEVYSLVTWLIFAIVLHMRLTAGWRGKRAAVLSIAGFIRVLFAFMGLIFF